MSRTLGSLAFGAALAALGALFGGDALAAGDRAWYVEAKAGPASLDARFGSRWPKVFDDDDQSGAVEVGYAVNRYLAVQAGFHDLGEYLGGGSPCPERAEGCIERLALEALGLCVEGRECVEVFAPVAADVSGYSLSAIPRWPVGERFWLFGRIGWLDWEADISHADRTIGRGRIDSFSDQGLLTGLGARYLFPKGLGVLLEYQRLDLDLGSTHLGVSYRF